MRRRVVPFLSLACRLILAGLLLPGTSTPAAAAPPNAPTGLVASSQPLGYQLQWINPSERTDGSTLSDFGGIRVYRDGIQIASLTRPRSAAGQPDGYADSSPPPETGSYRVAAFDRSSPVQVSAHSAPAVVGGCLLDPDEITIVMPWPAHPETTLVTYHDATCGTPGFETSTPWLSIPGCSIDTGPGGNAIKIIVDPEGLTPGAYPGSFDLVTSTTTMHGTVHLTIAPTSPALTSLPATFSLERPEGEPPVQLSILIANGTSQPIDATFSDGAGWLRSVVPSAHLIPVEEASVPLEINVAGLPPGVYHAAFLADSHLPGDPPLEIPVTLTVTPRLPDVPASDVAVDEIAFRCSSGETSIQFVELMPASGASTFRSTIGLRMEDRAGNVLFDGTGLFPGRADGEVWPAGTGWLLGNPALAGVAGVTPDYSTLPALDPLGGSVTLYDTSPEVQVLQRFTYGARGGAVAPAPGHSLQRVNGALLEKDLPDPRNFAGGTGMGLFCPCPGALIDLEYVEYRSTTPTDDRSYTNYGTGRGRFDVPQGTLAASGNGAFALVDVTESFYVDGVPAGIPLTFRARCTVHGSVTARENDLDIPYSASMNASIEESPANRAATSAYVSIYTCPTAKSVYRDIAIPLTQASLDVFTLRLGGWASGDHHGNSIGGSGSMSMQLDFLGLPPGARIRSCRGYQQEIPVPLALSAAGAEATFERARVSWTGAAGARFLNVERNVDGEGWTPVGLIVPDADGRAEFVDERVSPGRRIGYRLVTDDGPAGEVWLTIPSRPELSLAAHSNDAGGDVTVRFTLPVEVAPRIELFDITGRLLRRFEPGLKAAGSHELVLDSRTLASGIYFLRLELAGRAARTRLAIVR